MIINWIKKASLWLFSVLCFAGLTGCSDSEFYGGAGGSDVPSVEDYFDFSTTKDIQLSLDYGFNDYHVIFELFGENPISQDQAGNYIKTDKEPLFRAYTDKDGKYANGITLPAYVKEVYLYSDYIGTLSPVKLTVSDNGQINYDQKSYLAGKKTLRGMTGGGKSYPEGYLVLGGWDNNGRPDYLKETRYDIPARFVNSIRAFYTAASEQDFPGTHPELFGDESKMDIRVKKSTEVNLVFLQSGAAYDNAVGHYTYPTNNPPQSRADIKNPVIAFPRITSTYRSEVGAFYGDQVQLKYWNEETQEFEDKFPAGVSIGWFIISNSTNNSNRDVIEDDSRATFYSTSAGFARFSPTNEFLVNDEDKQRAVALLFDEDTKHMISLTFEDRMSSSLSNNYYDAGFFVHIVEEDAIETPPVLPPVDGKDDPVYSSYKGTLSFEDLWPNQGDYDMNDLVIEYESKQYTAFGSYNVVKTVDTFVAKHDGAAFINGFGYQLFGRFLENGVYVNRFVEASQIKSITVETESGIVSKFMKGQLLEPGQEHPTIVLFDDLREVLAKDAVFTVTVEFNGNGVNDRAARPPYNPFIIAKTDQGRGIEVHLPNHPNTSLANPALLGTGDDRSYPTVGLYYASDNNFPFAIHLSGAVNFQWPEEGVKINIAYPQFSRWVESGGKENTYWYNYPLK